MKSLSEEKQKNEQKFGGGGKPQFWKKWWFWLIVVVAVAAVAFTNTPEDKQDDTPTNTAEITTQKPIEKETDTPKPTQKKEETVIEYDELQQLYLDIDPKFGYSEMVDFVKDTKLPYSEEKDNGSRTIQVAFTEGCTVQSHKKENGDYLKIIYVYAENENSGNDDLEKYSIGTIAYCPNDSDLELINHYAGVYFSYYDAGSYISDFGTSLDVSKEMSRKEQLAYYFKNK